MKHNDKIPETIQIINYHVLEMTKCYFSKMECTDGKPFLLYKMYYITNAWEHALLSL